MLDVFVSSPYSDPDQNVIEERVKVAQRYVAQLASNDILAFSVLAYIHPILKDHPLPTDYEFWKDLCVRGMEMCEVVHVLCIEGWEDSVGVQDEIEIARSLKKRIVYITDIDNPSLL